MGWWRMLVVYPRYAANYRQSIWVAPAQVKMVDLRHKTIEVWTNPASRQAQPGAMYGSERGVVCNAPEEENAFIFDCRGVLKGTMDNRCSGFCRHRVAMYLRNDEIVLDVIDVILDWIEGDQQSMWCRCDHGKHRSQGARSIVNMFTGAVRFRERPRRHRWCTCPELTARELCAILSRAPWH